MSLSQCPTSWQNCSTFQWKRTLDDDCNPVMSDGRIFTEHRSSCLINSQLVRKHNLTNSNDFRAFLQRNGPSILEQQKHRSVKASRCHIGAGDWSKKYDMSIQDNNSRWEHYKHYDVSGNMKMSTTSTGLSGLGSDAIEHASPVSLNQLLSLSLV